MILFTCSSVASVERPGSRASECRFDFRVDMVGVLDLGWSWWLVGCRFLQCVFLRSSGLTPLCVRDTLQLDEVLS